MGGGATKMMDMGAIVGGVCVLDASIRACPCTIECRCRVFVFFFWF